MSSERTKLWMSLWILAGCVLLSFQFFLDFIDITFQDGYLEGYGYFINLVIFDVSCIVPLLLLLFSKDRFLMIWSWATVLSLNLTIGMGWQWGSFTGLAITFLSLTFFFSKRRGLLDAN